MPNNEEWERIYIRWGKQLAGYVRGSFKSLMNDAEDIAGQAIQKYVEWDPAKKMNPDALPALKTFARNLAIDRLRKLRPEAQFASNDLIDWLFEAVETHEIGPEAAAVARQRLASCWTLCFSDLCQPHETLAAAFQMGLQTKPSELVRAHSPSSLFVMMANVRQSSPVTGLTKDQFQTLCGGFTSRRLEVPVRLSVRNWELFPVLSAKVDSTTGNTLLREYFRGGVPAEEISQWTRAVRRRMIATLSDEGASAVER